MTNIQVGDTFIIFDTANPDSIKEYKATKVTKDTIFAGKDEVFYSAFCLPAEAAEGLREVLTIRAKLKKDFDDSISLIYNFINTINK